MDFSITLRSATAKMNTSTPETAKEFWREMKRQGLKLKVVKKTVFEKVKNAFGIFE